MKILTSFKILDVQTRGSEKEIYLNFFEDESQFVQDARVLKKINLTVDMILVVWSIAKNDFFSLNGATRFNLQFNILSFKLANSHLDRKEYIIKRQYNFEKFHDVQIVRKSGGSTLLSAVFADNFFGFFATFCQFNEDDFFIFDFCENIDNLSNNVYFENYKERYEKLSLKEIANELNQKNLL